jgi:hypothetical protein
MFASQHGLDNLNLIVDNNQISMLGYTDEIVSHGSFVARFNAFGWSCYEVDGHDVLAVQAILKKMKSEQNGKPKALIAKTLKGHGVPGLENAPLSHILNPKPELLDTLGAEGVLQLMVEGGPTVAASFHRENLINQYVMYIAPAFMGGNDGTALFMGQGASSINEMWRGTISSVRMVGDDIEIVVDNNSR